jgi:ABC-type bacteriocin/lantibiotic exporter with double-glycine peptidase domain
MRWLDVPYLPQSEPGGCLVACAAMVLAYLEQPALQEDVARQIGARPFGVPASNLLRLEAWGLEVRYGEGSLDELSAALASGSPPIVFVRTSELSYWREDTPHALVLVGLDATHAYVLDPAYSDEIPVTAALGDFLLAWSHFDQTYALILKSSS